MSLASGGATAQPVAAPAKAPAGSDAQDAWKNPAVCCRATHNPPPADWKPLSRGNDPRVRVSTVSIPGWHGLTGYLAMPVSPPKKGKRYPAIVIQVDNRGMNAHTKDIARRFALEGFITLAPDFLGPYGGQPADEKLADDMGEKQKDQEIVNFIRQAEDYLRSRPDVGKVGAVGFGKGGDQVDELVGQDRELQAAVSYYTNLNDLTAVPLIRAPILKHYGLLDVSHYRRTKELDETLTRFGKVHEFYTYPEAKWGFANDYDPTWYRKDDAELSWRRTIVFLKRYLD
ncbi:dienelactone hydrolase family protein [Novosphingobium flavum]|uniref:Dienelactone hydrolase family protein n=1 Tax=Novosphingobium flavum TaxID=1778672 RepID=A0A7X1FTJ3_9SPHN|nr:dienelactone hydrolase family protein [Novosphingobium flavum]MBC2666721.1 dienelactone hydrolase family protein [Novosphingobium flavum]